MGFDEFKIIDSIASKFPELDTTDDAAFVSLSNGATMVLTCDEFVENVHFKREWFSCEQIGHKAVAAAISDIAASGAKPRSILTAISIPKSYTESDIQSIYDGISSYIKKYDIDLIGGNVTSNPAGLSITTTAIGYTEFPIHRKNAFAEDIICITGELGRPALFLAETLGKNKQVSEIDDYIREKFFCPEAQLINGYVMGQSGLVHSITDISDGFIDDLGHILSSSGKGAEIDIARLPISEKTAQIAKVNNYDILDLAANSGEEYELIITMSESYFYELSSQLSCPLTKVGKITDSGYKILKNGKLTDSFIKGFSHS